MHKSQYRMCAYIWNSSIASVVAFCLFASYFLAFRVYLVFIMFFFCLFSKIVWFLFISFTCCSYPMFVNSIILAKVHKNSILFNVQCSYILFIWQLYFNVQINFTVPLIILTRLILKFDCFSMIKMFLSIFSVYISVYFPHISCSLYFRSDIEKKQMLKPLWKLFHKI